MQPALARQLSRTAFPSDAKRNAKIDTSARGTEGSPGKKFAAGVEIVARGRRLPGSEGMTLPYWQVLLPACFSSRIIEFEYNEVDAFRINEVRDKALSEKCFLGNFSSPYSVVYLVLISSYRDYRFYLDLFNADF